MACLTVADMLSAEYSVVAASLHIAFGVPTSEALHYQVECAFLLLAPDVIK